MDQQLLEPLKFYEATGKSLQADNTTDYFNSLLERSGVNVEENRSTVSAYDIEKSKLDAINKKIFRYKAFRIIAIIAIVIAVIAAICGIVIKNWIILALCPVVAIAMLIIILTVLTPSIRRSTEIQKVLSEKASKLFDTAMQQMQPLNALFSDLDTFNIIEKTIPDVNFYNCFTRDKEKSFAKNYDFAPPDDEETSALRVVSGDIAKNPFVFCRRLKHRLGVYTYHGTLLISWTETETDSNGRLRTVRRTQTLHASLTKPKPYYSTDTTLFFGSHAVPELCFSRSPKHSEDLSEKQLEKKIKKGKKKLEKKARKALKNGGSFQEMANSEFEVLFGVENRNNETQFRIMYTPLAQKNTVDLMRSDSGYGDDFSFVKAKKLNIIRSEHMQNWTMNTSPVNYRSHSVDISRAKFESFNNEYFKSVFFDLAPLLAVPIYNEEPPSFLEDESPLDCHYSRLEHEAMANSIRDAEFAHPDSATEAILKTSVISSNKDGDTVAVTAFSYSAEDRLDFVPVFGGDGHIHPVPVHWIEYIPIEAKSTIKIVKKDEDAKKEESEDALFNGLFASILK